MKIKLVASDIDGTIVDANNQIPTNNFKAFNTIKEKNIDFAICTGKTYGLAKKICEQSNATYGIFANGMHIVDFKNGTDLYKNLLDKEIALEIIKLAKQDNLHVHLYTDTEVITEDLKYMDLRNYTIKEKEKNLIKIDDKDTTTLDFNIVEDIYSYIQESELEIYKLIISSDTSLSDLKQQILKQFNVDIVYIKKVGKYKDKVINKEYKYLDISTKNISKDNAVNILSKHLNINNEEVMAIGDNINDLGMVKNAGVGVAVSNSYASLKKVASYVTENPVEQSAFAEAINKFLI